MPVVVCSASDWNDKPLTPTKAIANNLAGAAHVVEFPDRWLSRRFGEQMPRQFGCWNGAIRVYWAPLDVVLRPTLTFFGFQNGSETRSGHRRARLRMTSWHSNVAVARVLADGSTWESIAELIEASQVKRLREAGRTEEYAEHLIVLTDQFKARTQELEALLQDMNVELEAAQNEADEWRSALDAKKQVVEALHRTSRGRTLIAHVEDAVERAAKTFSSELAFKPNGKSIIKNNPFRQPESLYKAFSFLAKEYRNARMKVKSCPDLDGSCRTKSGFSYASHQSVTTIGQYEDDYTCQWQGNNVTMMEHLRFRNTRKPEETIRVGFFYDEATKKVVIGYIGQHQRNASS